MTKERQREAISQIFKLLNEIINDDGSDDSPAAEAAPNKVEMLTIKECTEVVHGFSEHSIRQLVAQGKIPYIRAGLGKRGKILINKADLLAYLNKPA